MWPYDYINPMIPYFEGAKQVAANVAPLAGAWIEISFTAGIIAG